MSTEYTNETTSNYAYINTESTVMAGSYYNYFETPGLYGPWQQQGVMYPAQFPPTPAPTNPAPVEPITQNIYNTLSHIKEKPKNYKRNICKCYIYIKTQYLPRDVSS